METQYEIKKSDFTYRTGGITDADTSPLRCTPHMHKHIEFFILYEGETNAYIDSEKYSVHAGQLCISFPNQIHSFETLKKEKYELFIINPDIMPELEETFFQSIPETATYDLDSFDERVFGTLRRITEIRDSDSEYKNVLIKGLILAFFCEILDKIKLTDVRSVSSHSLKAIINYCSKNYAQDLSLTLLEEELHISKYYISHLFSMKMNVRFNDYINSLRITEACRQLKQTDKTITEISECVGFGTLRTFNRAFIKHIGMSPSEYRRTNPEKIKSVSII